MPKPHGATNRTSGSTPPQKRAGSPADRRRSARGGAAARCEVPTGLFISRLSWWLFFFPLHGGGSQRERRARGRPPSLSSERAQRMARGATRPPLPRRKLVRGALGFAAAVFWHC